MSLRLRSTLPWIVQVELDATCPRERLFRTVPPLSGSEESLVERSKFMVKRIKSKNVAAAEAKGVTAASELPQSIQLLCTCAVDNKKLDQICMQLAVDLAKGTMPVSVADMIRRMLTKLQKACERCYSARDDVRKELQAITWVARCCKELKGSSPADLAREFSRIRREGRASGLLD